MPRKIAAAVVVMLLGLAASPSRATDVNFLEISLLKYDSSYGIAVDAGKLGATSCKLQTPSDGVGSSCLSDTTEVIRWDLDWGGLLGEIGVGDGLDWTLTWDEGLGTETTVYIDFGAVSEDDFFSLPMITNPLDGATGVPLGTSIDWTWPAEPEVGGVSANLYFGDLEALMPGPVSFDCESDEFSTPPDPTTWDPDPGCLSPGMWTAVVLNENEYLRDVSVGLNIVGNWTLENDEWLSAGSLDISTFTVIPEPSTALLFGLGLVGLVVGARRSAL